MIEDPADDTRDPHGSSLARDRRPSGMIGVFDSGVGGLSVLTVPPTSASLAPSKQRTEATACLTVSATAEVIARVTPARRGVSAIATRSAVTASSRISRSATPASTSVATTSPSCTRPAEALTSWLASGRACSTASDTGSAGSA